MSAFNSDDNQDTGTESFVDRLVKAKGDQWRDPEVIAKGKVEADTYIAELKAQNEELKKMADQKAKLEELIAKIEQKAVAPTTTNTQSSKPGSTEESNTKTAASEEEIQSLVEKTITEREKAQTTRQNIAQVDKQLSEMFGTEAKEKVKDKAASLGLSVERLQELAAESPTAFFGLFGEKPKDFRPMTTGTIRTESLNQHSSDRRDNKYYQKLRKENPRLFNRSFDQMIKDRERLGDTFYK